MLHGLSGKALVYLITFYAFVLVLLALLSWTFHFQYLGTQKPQSHCG